MLLRVLLVLFFLWVILGAPWWGWHRWGYYPSGFGLLVLGALVVLLVRAERGRPLL